MDENGIKLGEKYRDTITGFEGTAISKHEYLFGCTRVTLETMHENDIKQFTFDAPAIVEVATEEPVTSDRKGGPRATPSPRPTG